MAMLMHSNKDVPVNMVEMENLRTLVKRTATYQPMRHADVVNTCVHALYERGLGITDQEFVLSQDGMRMFGVAHITGLRDLGNTGWRPIVGFRNSYDRSTPAGMVVGSRVMVCSNLAFTGNLGEARRKHTLEIYRDFPQRVEEALDSLEHTVGHMTRQYETWKASRIPSTQMLDHIVMGMWREGIIGSQRLGKVMEQIDAPDHEPFKGRTLWTVFNAVTESMKGLTPFRVSRETVDLHDYIDTVGLRLGITRQAA